MSTLQTVKDEIDKEYRSILRDIAAGKHVSEKRIKDAIVASGRAITQFELDLEQAKQVAAGHDLLNKAESLRMEHTTLEKELADCNKQIADVNARYRAELKPLEDIRWKLNARKNQIQWEISRSEQEARQKLKTNARVSPATDNAIVCY